MGLRTKCLNSLLYPIGAENQKAVLAFFSVVASSQIFPLLQALAGLRMQR